MKNRKPWFRISLLFIGLTVIFIALRQRLDARGVSSDVLIAGNLILFAATLLSFTIFEKTVINGRPQATVRGLYGSFMVKFFICVVAAFAYILAARQNVNKPALFFCMGLYVVYTAVEVRTLMRLLKEKKDNA